MTSQGGRLSIVSTGPGSTDHITPSASAALSRSHVIVGYRLYLAQLGTTLLHGKEVLAFDMGQERARAEAAIDLALAGQRVALASGGDAGVYGMAGLVFRHLEERGSTPDTFHIEVIPGITAASAAAALLGAPLMQDFASISLSDRYVPWEFIERRLEAAAQADFVIVLYEPASRLRPTHIERAQKTILRHRSAATPVGIVRDAYRSAQQVIVVSLGKMLEHSFDMHTTVVIGNSVTRRVGARIVTDRGYDM